MKELTKQEMEKLEKLEQVIEIYDEYIDYNFKFYYMYQGDVSEVIFLNNKFLMYMDLDEYMDKIKTRKDEKRIITKLLKEELEDNYFNILEELEFIDSNILKDIKGEL